MRKIPLTLSWFVLAGAAVAQGRTLADVAYALDTVTLLVCALLVALMQPGFALLEAGLHSSKNVINIFMKNIVDFAVAGLAFWAVGFFLMYGGGPFLRGYETGMNVPVAADFFFQMVFAATAATIVSGAVGGRMRFGAYVLFSVVMTALIYPFLGAWHWGGGWLSTLGFYDFAGSSVVHAVGGFAALGAVLAIGPRVGRYSNGAANPMPGHNMALAGLGMFLLWIGWFGFNPGSQLAFSTVADAQAFADIFLNTNLSAAAGGITAMLLSWILFRRPDISMSINGVLAGLVSITAGPDVIGGLSAVLVGGIGGALVIGSVLMFDRLRVDDPVGAISVHGVVGIWGTLAVGLFGGAQLGVQLVGTFSYALAALGAGYLVFLLLKVTVGLRVDTVEEIRGLDLVEHGMGAYSAEDRIRDPLVLRSEQPVAG